MNPLRPAYRTGLTEAPEQTCLPMEWTPWDGGLRLVGYQGNDFAFDNESPRHRAYIPAYLLASRLTTNGEFLEFMEAGGYHQPEWWLSSGWNAAQQGHWQAPLYWENRDGEWWHYTLWGMQPINKYEPVTHVSYYEADAFARWKGHRLPTEQEWEHAMAHQKITGNFLDSGRLHPGIWQGAESLGQGFGDVWEWTQSSYAPYPGFHPLDGSLGEYNGKFMVGQMVLRGGSCVTPKSHIRPTYRNFFQPEARWQFSGIRLAHDAPTNP